MMCVCVCLCVVCARILAHHTWKQNSPFILKDIFIGYKILGWKKKFFQHFKYIIPLSAGLHSFWEICYTHCLSSFMSFPPLWLLLRLSPFWLVLSNLIMICLGVLGCVCLFCLRFIKVLGSVLVTKFEKFPNIISSVFLVSFLLFSEILFNIC